MICPVCGCFFCNDEADRNPRKYCSAECQRKAKRVRDKRHRQRKEHYLTEKAALAALNSMPWRKGATDPGIYWCCDKGFQITSNIGKIPHRKVAWTAKNSRPLLNPVLSGELADLLLASLEPPGQDC